MNDPKEASPNALAQSVPKILGASQRWETLELSDEDRLVLSRADGRLSATDVATILSLPLDRVEQSLARLVQLGVIELAVTDRPKGEGGALRAAPVEKAAVQEELDLTPEHVKRIVDLFAKLESVNHYELLGIARTADKKEIKRAYFEATALFHPDRFFRKRLGTYKVQMETIFDRMTQAHDALTKPGNRSAYDQYLRDHERTRGIESLLETAFAEARRIEKDVVASAADADDGPPLLGMTTDKVPERADAAAAAASLAARKEALARRLLGPGRKPPSAAPSRVSPAVRSDAPGLTTEGAMDSLRRRYHARIRAARESNARRYADHGSAALAADDPVAAVNALRVAVTLDPDNVELARSFRSAQVAADTILYDMYVRQAKYEEANGNWVEAAKSWRKVTAARADDANAHDRAANALLRAAGDLHEAARLAQVACGREPHNPAFKLTLASVYVEAGLALNARRELEAALQLAPHDGTIRALLERVGE